MPLENIADLLGMDIGCERFSLYMGIGCEKFSLYIASSTQMDITSVNFAHPISIYSENHLLEMDIGCETFSLCVESITWRDIIYRYLTL